MYNNENLYEEYAVEVAPYNFSYVLVDAIMKRLNGDNSRIKDLDISDVVEKNITTINDKLKSVRDEFSDSACKYIFSKVNFIEPINHLIKYDYFELEFDDVEKVIDYVHDKMKQEYLANKIIISDNIDQYYTHMFFNRSIIEHIYNNIDNMDVRIKIWDRMMNIELI